MDFVSEGLKGSRNYLLRKGLKLDKVGKSNFGGGTANQLEGNKKARGLY